MNTEKQFKKLLKEENGMPIYSFYNELLRKLY